MLITKVKYSREPDNPTKSCKARGSDLRVHFKVLSLVAGVLLEKQVLVVCPNLGVLSAVVLSLIPLIRPFQWQSLLLPVSMMAFG
ncbi:hypothetical protein SO802_016790 [Lithocarpus litseifolius]|uniref:cDENN domain-containing protein n=1 Tax=Lithocarpus litseifolius TaxID=425828 RepID=A0AAW2D001_9ROSI